jgi:hypothetical protein
MTTKWQMNPTARVSITAFQAGENSKINGSEHTIVSQAIQHSNRPDSDLQKEQRKKSSIVGPTIEPAKQPNSSNESSFKILLEID